MKTKVVFHLDWEKEECLVMALNNMSNLFKATSQQETSACVLANGAAVKLFQRKRAFEYALNIQTLSQKGVRFLVCHNSLNNLGISQEDLLAPCEIVKAGIVELIRLQAEGYAYVKP